MIILFSSTIYFTNNYKRKELKYRQFQDLSYTYTWTPARTDKGLIKWEKMKKKPIKVSHNPYTTLRIAEVI